MLPAPQRGEIVRQIGEELQRVGVLRGTVGFQALARLMRLDLANGESRPLGSKDSAASVQCRSCVDHHPQFL